VLSCTETKSHMPKLGCSEVQLENKRTDYF